VGFFSRLFGRQRPLPPVSVGPETREQVEGTTLPASPRDVTGAAAALREALGVILPTGEAFLEAAGVPAARAEAQLYGLAWAGCVAALEAGGEDRAAALEAISGARVALREYVGFDGRGEYDEEPELLLDTLRTLAAVHEDAGAVAAGVTADRLKLTGRPGSEGWFRLAMLAWIAGEALAEAPPAA
jgi:hypothetical protein